MSGTVHVVGAGLAGLSAAASLADAGNRVVLLKVNPVMEAMAPVFDGRAASAGQAH